MAKEGRLSKDEWAYIEANWDSMSPEEIADKLDRNVEPIVAYMRKHGRNPDKVEDYAVQAEYDLKKRPIWKDIKQQFSKSELDTFLYHWSRIVGQFQGDILPTEELQILDAVKLEILMNRALIEQQQSVTHRQRLTEMVEQLHAENRTRSPEDRDDAAIYDLEKQISALRMAAEAMSRDYKVHQEKKSAILKELRGTREQRVKDIQNTKKTFETLATRCITDHEWVKEKNAEMEKMRLAVEVEKGRLSEYHTYVDGQIDQPLLTSETVILTEPPRSTDKKEE